MAEQVSNTGAKLYLHAKERIPGGTQLLSKRPEMFLPDQWPSYYSRARGVEVWDLDGNKYIDMSYNGIGACILGAADPDVDEAVKVAIDAGSMSTLNAPEEVELAVMPLRLVPVLIVNPSNSTFPEVMLMVTTVPTTTEALSSMMLTPIPPP